MLAPEVARAAFVSAMGAAVTSVHLLTTDGPGGRLGLTVSAVSSVSADPPMLLACVRRSSPVAAAVKANGVLAINTLAAYHAQIADTFAGRPWSGEPYAFGAGEWSDGELGPPLLRGAVAWFECRLVRCLAGGSHAILLASVARAERGSGTALAHVGGAYARPAALGDVPRPARRAPGPRAAAADRPSELVAISG